MRDRLKGWLEHPRAVRWIVAVAMLLMLPALAVGLVLDDYTHRAMLDPTSRDWLRRGPHQLYEFMPSSGQWFYQALDDGFMPWFADPELHATFWRPVSSLTLALDHTLWPVWMGHLHSLAWYALLIVVTHRVFRRLLAEPWVAALATLVYAIDDAHASTVAWLANRNAVVAMVFATGALLMHIRWREDGCRRSAVAAPVLLLLGLLSGEIALSITAYLFGYAMFLEEGSIRKRIVTLIPCAALVVAWRIIYDLLGYGAGNSSVYFDPVTEPARFAGAVARRLPVLLQGQVTPISPEIGFFFKEAATAQLLLAACTLGALAVICAKRVKAKPVWRFAFTGMVIGAIPLCAVFAADRVLLPVGIGGSLIVADLVGTAKDELNLAERGLAKFWIVTQLFLSALLMPAKAYSIELVGGTSRHGAMSLDRAGDLTGKTLMMVALPDFFWGGMATHMRKVHGKSYPAKVRMMATMLSGCTVTRVDERTLEITAREHLMELGLDKLLRAPDRRPRVGEQVKLTDATVTVTKLTPAGRMKQIRWSHPKSLVAPDRVWVLWTDNGFVPYELPAIGESHEVPPGRMTDLIMYRHSE